MGALLKRRFGISVCETALQRVMSRHGLPARIRQVRKAKPHAEKATGQPLPDNLLNREFQAVKLMHQMVTDVTYVPYFENGEWHWGYLALVQDLFDRSIVARVYSRKQDVRLANATLQILSFRGLAAGAMLHSDRGSIYTANIFRELAKQIGVTQSYSRTANCYDNATMECFNGTFKVEALYNPLLQLEKPSFKKQSEFIGRYIKFYNKKHPCSVIENLTMQEYRQNYHEEINRSVNE